MAKVSCQRVRLVWLNATLKLGRSISVGAYCIVGGDKENNQNKTFLSIVVG